MGPLLKLFSGHTKPIVGAYDVAKSSGRMGRGLYVTDSPGYASQRAMVAGSEAPVVYPLSVPTESVLQLNRFHPALPEGKTWEEVWLEQKFNLMSPKQREKFLDALGVQGAEYPGHQVAPMETNPARMFVIRKTDGVKTLSGDQFCDGGLAQMRR